MRFRRHAVRESTNPCASVWDLLAHPELGDVRSRPYTERRALLLDLLHDVPPPIQAVPATDDPDVAQDWYDTLQGQGIEGVVCKRATSPYRAGRSGRRCGTRTPSTPTSSATSARHPGPIAWRSGCRTEAACCRRR
ncbi:ATP-dependent DNA ligase [Streptomyces sp. NBC_01445]|uniref:ATP-dependent DNA ligase n=1 Tax=Streptomyces sp. NBC_01445 TaxID=2903869 RepID=UPI003FA3CF9E